MRTGALVALTPIGLVVLLLPGLGQRAAPNWRLAGSGLLVNRRKIVEHLVNKTMRNAGTRKSQYVRRKSPLRSFLRF